MTTQQKTPIDVVRWVKSKKPSLQDLTTILKGEGLSWDLYSDTPGTKYGRHKHDFDDFIVIVSGSMRLCTDQGEWIMKPGDRIDLPANTIHWAEMVGRKEVKYLSASK